MNQEIAVLAEEALSIEEKKFFVLLILILKLLILVQLSMIISAGVQYRSALQSKVKPIRIVSDYGNWRQIKYGNGYGYVWKEATKLSDGASIKNLNGSQSNSGSSFVVLSNLAVYDNTSGNLVPFAVLSSGVKYPYISSNGPDQLKVDVGGRIGYVYGAAVQLDNSYSYTSYDINLQEMVELQFSLGAQTDKKYDTYVRYDAITFTSSNSGTISGTMFVEDLV